MSDTIKALTEAVRGRVITASHPDYHDARAVYLKELGTMDPLRFRTLMRRFVTGVTMVTCSEGLALGGVTVNAFSALSLTPPQVLVCLDNGSRTLGQILAAESFAVNVLGAGQQELARRFADKSLTAAERFAHVPTWPLTTGAPAIQGSIAVLNCRLVHAWRSGDHTVLVGEVVDGSAEGEDDPLIFYAGGYRQLVARRDIACATSPPTAPHNRFTVHTEDAAAPRCSAERATWIARRPHHQGRNGHGRASTDEPHQTQREQLGDLVEAIPSGHDLPAIRAATGLLSESVERERVRNA